MPGLSGATTSRNRFQALCSHFSQKSVVVLITRRHGFQHALVTHDAQDKEHHEPKVSDITHRSLLMTVADPTFFLYASQCVCRNRRRAPHVDGPQCQPYFGSCLDLLHAAQIMDIYAFVLCFFQSSKCLGLLVFSRFLTFDRLVQLLVLVAHVSHSDPSTPWKMA